MQEWRHENHETYYNNEWTYHENMEVEPVQPVQMKIQQSNTYRKDSNWLYYDDEPWIKQSYIQQWYVSIQQWYVSIPVAYSTYPRSNWEFRPRDGPRDNNSILYATWYIYRYKEQPLKKETSQNESRLQFSWRQFQQQGQCKSPNSIQTQTDICSFTSIT